MANKLHRRISTTLRKIGLSVKENIKAAFNAFLEKLKEAD